MENPFEQVHRPGNLLPVQILTWKQLVDLAGGRTPARWLVQSGKWVQVVRNAYVARGTELDLSGRLAVLRTVLPDDVAVAGRAALWTYGVLEAPGRLDLLVERGRHLLDRPDVRIRSARLPEEELCEVDGLLLVSAARAVADIAREESLVEAVVVMDATLRAGAVDLERLDSSIDRARGLRGVEALRAARTYADGRSESAQETRLRLRLLFGGLTGLRVQVDLYGVDGHVGRTDLYVHGVAIEYDGVKERLEKPVFTGERRRQNGIADLEVQVRRFTASDVYRRPAEALVREVLRAQAIAPKHLTRVRPGRDTLRPPRLRPLPTLAEIGVVQERRCA